MITLKQAYEKIKPGKDSICFISKILDYGTYWVFCMKNKNGGLLIANPYAVDKKDGRVWAFFTLTIGMKNL